MRDLYKENIFLPCINSLYSLKVAEKLVERGFNVKVISISRKNKEKEYSRSLKRFISKNNPHINIVEDFLYPNENFAESTKKGFSWVSIKKFREIGYYEKLFLLSLDRHCFFPISNLKAYRLFYNLFSYFYKQIIDNNIGSVVFFGTPHGYFNIVLWTVAKYLEINVIYSEGTGIHPNLSTLENTLEISRKYDEKFARLGSLSNNNQDSVNRLVKANIDAKFYTRNISFININKLFLRRIIALLFKHLFRIYDTPELFLLRKPPRGYFYFVPLIKYYFEVLNTTKYIRSKSFSQIPNKKGKKILSFFLHQQPEASTMPLGGVFSDQLLSFNLIAEALETNYQILVKEHPYFYADAGAERYERSKEFYSHLLKDERVSFMNYQVDSIDLIKKSQFVVSIGGTVGWQALTLGKPCIVFGNTWYSTCKSCFTVNSIDSLKNAFKVISSITKEEVNRDLSEFLSFYSKRLIYAPPSQQSFIEGMDLMDSLNIENALNNFSKAIDIALTN